MTLNQFINNENMKVNALFDCCIFDTKKKIFCFFSWIDALGRKTAMLVVNGPIIVAWFMMYSATSLWEIFVGNTLLGFGAGLMESPIITYVSKKELCLCLSFSFLKKKQLPNYLFFFCIIICRWAKLGELKKFQFQMFHWGMFAEKKPKLHTHSISECMRIAHSVVSQLLISLISA